MQSTDEGAEHGAASRLIVKQRKRMMIILTRPNLVSMALFLAFDVLCNGQRFRWLYRVDFGVNRFVYSRSCPLDVGVRVSPLAQSNGAFSHCTR